MQKNLIYAGAFLALVLLQIFLVDNISLSVYFHPLIYVAFIILLPLMYPLGYLAGYVWGLSPFWIYALLKIDYIIKTVWCTIRLKRKTWMHGFAQKAA